MKYLMMNSMTEFNTLMDKINGFFGYPNPATKTYRYADAEEDKTQNVLLRVNESDFNKIDHLFSTLEKSAMTNLKPTGFEPEKDPTDK